MTSKMIQQERGFAGAGIWVKTRPELLSDWKKLETERLGSGSKLSFLVFLIIVLIRLKAGVIKFLMSSDEMKNDTSNFVRGGSNGFSCAKSSSHAPVKIPQS